MASRKTVALMALLTLSVPYLRAPLCQAGSHDHPEAEEGVAHAEHAIELDGSRAMEGHHGSAAVSDETSSRDPMAGRHIVHDARVDEARVDEARVGDPDAADCHDRMRCDAAVDLVALPDLGSQYARVGERAALVGVPGGHPDVTPTLELPPPRRI